MTREMLRVALEAVGQGRVVPYLGPGVAARAPAPHARRLAGDEDPRSLETARRRLAQCHEDCAAGA